MQSRYEVYEDSEGLWRWRHVADNGEIIADSGESYANKWNAERAKARAIELSAEEWEQHRAPPDEVLDGGFGRR